QVPNIQSLAHLTDPPCTITANVLPASAPGSCDGPLRDHRWGEPLRSTKLRRATVSQAWRGIRSERAESEFDDERSQSRNLKLAVKRALRKAPHRLHARA